MEEIPPKIHSPVKTKENTGKNCHNQFFSELWKLTEGLQQFEESLFKKTAELC